MALLGRNPDGGRPRRRGVIIAALAVLSITGCTLLQYLGFPEDKLTFSHQRHLEEGLSCSDCHSTYEDGDEVQAVRPAQCALCHADMDAEKAPDQTAASLFDGEDFRAAHAGALSDELKFSHATHVASGASCESCHEGIATSTAVDSSMTPRMDECIKCHQSVGVENSCKVCHTVLDTDTMPDNHHQQWTRTHGVVVRADMEGAANDCSLCHTDRTCITCHQDQAPASHNNFWRLRGHGVVADMDRDACKTCHEPSSCIRCHQENAPLSHNSGAWGSPLNTHCLSCHFPLQEESCAVCHKSTPSHLDAPDQPSWHSPGMDCRSCHGVTAPLPHVDNGDDCTFCHK